VSLDWLATGEGEMCPVPPTHHEIMEARHAQVAASGQAADGRPAAADNKAVGTLDEELMDRVVDGITRVYKEENVRLPPVDLGRLTARFQADLVEAYDDPDERWVGLKLLLRNLRTDLRADPAAAGTIFGMRGRSFFARLGHLERAPGPSDVFWTMAAVKVSSPPPFFYAHPVPPE
jgi:hypothetical protein